MADEEKKSLTNQENPQVLLAWSAPLRAYVKRSKYVLRFYLAVSFLISLIVVFIGDMILLVPVWALLFLFYTLTVTPPPTIDHKITQFGIDTEGATVRYDALSHFFFTNRFGYDILTVVTHPPYYNHFYLVLSDVETKRRVIQILSSHIVYQEKPRKTFIDKAADLLTNLVAEDNVRKISTPPVVDIAQK